ncbi:MAG: hypothetical protein ACRDOE_22755 [Streptosporangiaceae bacterium]
MSTPEARLAARLAAEAEADRAEYAASVNCRPGPDFARRDPCPCIDCPGPKCPGPAGASMLMCPAHWRQVPKPLRRAVWRAWRRGAGMGSQAHVAAMRAAIGAVSRAA